MVPNFALLLTFDGISLLRQTAQGWANLSDVPLDNDDLTGAVIALREQAQALDPTGAQVALIIPNEQIRYLDIPEPAGRPRAKNRAVREALDGATPYEVDELVFDHVPLGRQRMIAAVAKETLEEAEVFVRQHGFDPVSFLALPPEGAFDGLVFLGSPVSWLGPEPTRPEGAFTIYPADAEALTPLGVKTSVHEGPGEDAETALPVEDDSAVAPTEDMAATQADTPTEAQPIEPPQVLSVQSTQGPAAAVETPSALESLEGTEPSLDAAAPIQEPATETEPDRAPVAPEEEAALLNPAPEVATPAITGTENPGPVEQRAPESIPETHNSAIPPEAAPSGGEQPTQQSFLDELEDLDSTLGAGLDDVEFENKLAAALGEENTPDAPKPRAQAAPGLTTEPTSAPEATPAMSPLAEPQADHATATAPQEQAPALPVAAPEPDAPKSFSDVFSTTPPEQTSPTLDFSEMRARRDAVPPAPKPLELSPQSEKPQAPVAPTPPKTPAVAPTVAPTPEAKPAALAARHLSAERPIHAQPPAPAAPVPPAPKAKQPATGMTPLARIKPVKKAIPIDELPADHPLARKPAAPGQPTQEQKDQLQGALAAAAASVAKKAKASTATKKPVEDESEKFTVFGARNRPPVGGKPKFLGLALTLGLLLFLAGVAAWATVFLDEGFAGLFDRNEPQVVATAPAPQPTAAPEVPQATAPATSDPAPSAPSEPDANVQLAALDTGEPAATPPIAALPNPVPLRVLTPEEAAATYAATGVWQRAPVAPHGLPLDEVDSLYLAAIDPKVPGTDAVALPDPQRLGNDLQVADPGLPPPAGVTFDIDERGLVRATAEGAITPDGFRVYTGRPPAVPPERGAETAALAPPTEAPAREALSTTRPKARPSDLTEQRERATLGGISLQELAAIRPVLRPRTAQEEALQDQPEATAQAVTRSLIPLARPRNMAAIVERAEKTPQPVQTAAVAPRTVNPSIPSNASVSRAATVNNAINLNKINLIGVFGTPSNRRALVRLPNGRYQKVKIGDRLDGGRVATISESELRYTKSGRNVTLKMPRS